MKQKETLFVVSEQTGQVVPVDFDSPIAAVSWEERNVRLQNVVTLLAHKSMLEGFVSFETPARSSYGERALAVRESAQNQIEQLTIESKMEFAYAVGHFSLINAGYDEESVRVLSRTAFSDFLKEYYGPRHYKEAQVFRRKLAADIGLMHSQPNESESQNTLVIEGLLVDTVLNNHEKLRAILCDERAGFLPATNREKTYVLTLLDYIDRRRGTADQLLEVFRNSQGFIRSGDTIYAAGVNQGKRATESIIYELGDYAGNAISSHRRLADLQNILTEIYNPKLTLEVAIGADHVGFAELYRYSVLRDLYDAQLPDLLPRSEDPMRTVEERWTTEGEGKHKAVTDRFTRENQESEIAEAMQKFVSNTSVHQARTLLSRALSNEERRAMFFLGRLHDVAELGNISRVFDALVNVSKQIVGECAKET